MEEKKKGKGGIIALLLILFLACAAAGVYGYLNKDRNVIHDKNNTTDNTNVENNPVEDTPKTDDKTETVTVENDFEKVEVSNLNTKLSSLDFSLKTKSESNEEEWLTLTSEIVDGKVTNTITINEGGESVETITRSYTVEDVENAISVGTGISVQGNGYADFYILTSNGEVYHIEDEIGEVKATSNYIGMAKNMNIKQAASIAVVDQSFNLSDTAETTTPTVYIKTNDGRIFTDEPIKFQDELIEVIEK